ncbi:hypothetical protein [Chelatococcus reniformis]|uniref:Uncharacterized protein n=1 Tax=Chelatococcus reniformis TaxID=1494448 RepID=A0A916TW95_9HYPH|nr:hypothetical protein [Chelatococcus reniformis]GGC46036.1 hypothetical protein GCM10010994_01440 [Chelatococcus reniformis]
MSRKRDSLILGGGVRNGVGGVRSIDYGMGRRIRSKQLETLRTHIDTIGLATRSGLNIDGRPRPPARYAAKPPQVQAASAIEQS